MALSIAEGQELANKIEDWLKASGTRKPSSELENFTEDLRKARNVNLWAGVDYGRMLPLRFEKQVLVSVLTLVRNVLVFAPILLTWWALREASREFSRYVAQLESQGTEVQINFLKFWQDMDGLSSFANVAGLDALLMAVLIGLTFLIGFIETATQRPEKLRRQHESLMISLEKSLSGYRYMTVADINIALQGTLGSLRTSSQHIEKGTEALAVSTQQAFETLQGIKKISEDDFRPVLESLRETIVSVRQTGDLNMSFVDVIAATRKDLEGQLKVTRDGFAEVVRNVEVEGEKVLALIRNNLTSATESISSTAEDISTRLAIQTTSELRGIAELIERASSALEAGFGSAVQKLADASFVMERNLKVLEQSAERVRQESENLAVMQREEMQRRAELRRTESLRNDDDYFDNGRYRGDGPSR
jgi:hypothetical protein